ncbi:MAG: hypothetical protein NC432_08675 [Roseburia sp.]|nr:hypothetical protein [Roseburia sp.]MCM1097813.1 hypothetical protein [Ruminococcus flavefaciens]
MESEKTRTAEREAEGGNRSSREPERTAGGRIPEAQLPGWLREIVECLERDPDMPYLIPREDRALEAYARMKLLYPGTKLAVKRGMRYLTVSDAALRHLFEQLERERGQFAEVVAAYDREIAGIRGLMGREQGTGIYWAPDSLCRPPATGEERRKYREALEGKSA